MGSFKLARRLPSTSILTEPWIGTTVTGRPVVAHLTKEPWTKTNFVSRFASFQRGWQGLRQVGIAPLLEVGQAATGALWVVEEFIEGETLRTLMNAALAQKSPLTVAEALAIAQQVARGLVTLSKQLPPLHHGDVCGSTIVVGTDGDVRLAGVGLAECIDADATLGPARAELFVIAPETLTQGTTPQSDVFKLGLVLLELLTGRTLFAGTSHAEVKGRAEKYPGLTPQHFPNFPPAVAALLAGTLAKDPAARPGVVEVEGALGKALVAAGGSDGPHGPAAAAFNRLFKGRTPMLKGLEGTEPLVLTPLAFAALPAPSASPPMSAQVGATNADGSVTLAKVRTTRMTSEEMAIVRANEAAEAAREVAAEWNARHAADEGNPKDFALGQLLLEKQRISAEQADASLQQSQSFGSTLFYSLCFLGHLDEDEGLPFAADLLKQRFLTGPQLLELGLTSANAPLLPRETADQWQVVPLKLEAGALTVAIADPTRVDVLDEVKRRAKVRAVNAVRATERTLTEGLLRVYDGKTALPEWALPKKAPPAPLPPLALDPNTLPPLDELPPLDDLGLPPPPSMELPPMPSAPTAARAPMSSPPMSRPMPSAPPAVAPPFAAPPAPHSPNLLDITSRLFDAVLSLVPERGPEGSRMIGLVRAVAKQSGATGLPLEQLRLCTKAIVIAALLEGKRAFETPSLPAVSAVLGTHWREFEPVIKPLLDGDESPPADPRTVVLMLAFSLAASLGTVPSKLPEAATALGALKSRYPPAAIAAIEAVLSR